MWLEWVCICAAGVADCNRLQKDLEVDVTTELVLVLVQWQLDFR